MKAVVKLGGVELAGNSPIAWRLQTGVQPYKTTFSVHKSAWTRRLKGQVGKPLTLEVTDTRGASQKINDVTILHETPSDSINRVSFVVADRRWKWPYTMVSRDYNVPRKSGDKTILHNSVPKENLVTVDQYDYKAYSLKDGQFRWGARNVIEDILQQVDPGRWFIESFPISSSGRGGFTLQNIFLRDGGDAAIARALSYVPGAELYIDIGGRIRVIDGTDIDKAEQHFGTLPPPTRAGDHATRVSRSSIRPRSVRVHYHRELELVFDFEDNYENTQGRPDRNEPYLENVLPTVDEETKITRYDPVAGRSVTDDVAMGTWVPVHQWLSEMDKKKPAGSLPWNFETIGRHWLVGDLEGVLGGAGSRGIPDLDPEANVMMRVQALRQHFRQTYRINRRYMDRIRSIEAVRVAPIDSVSGHRPHAAVWGQACVVPSLKGKRIASRKDDGKSGTWRNVEFLPKGEEGLLTVAPGPARVSFIDREQGIFRVEWVASPYGTVDSIVPSHVVDEMGNKAVPLRDLFRQDDAVMGAGMQRLGAANGVMLDKKMKFHVMMTVVPSAPNNRNQYHVEEIKGSDVKGFFRSQLKIDGGDGPPLDVYVPPGESVARFGWSNDSSARHTAYSLFGMNSDNPNDAGLPYQTRNLFGWNLLNGQRELRDHSRSVAAEVLATFADTFEGRVATRLPTGSLALQGNMSGATIQVGSAPSAKVQALHEFPGQRQLISRFALLPEDTRRITLGIIPLKDGDA